MHRRLALTAASVAAVVAGCSFRTGEPMYEGRLLEGFAVLNTRPTQGATDVPIDITIAVNLTGYPDPEALAAKGWGTLASDAGPVEWVVAVDLIDRAILCDPKVDLAPRTRYTLTIQELRSLAGEKIDPAPAPLRFTTGTGRLDPTPPPARSLATDVQPLFERSCSIGGCHDARARSGGLDLGPLVAHGELVDKAATGSTLPRVTRGDPSRSYLLRKLLGTPDIKDAVMPVVGIWSADDSRRVSDWIATGAAP